VHGDEAGGVLLSMKVLILAAMLLAQGPGFEVASVKPVKERTGPGGFSMSGDLVTYRYTTLLNVMIQAFDLKFGGQVEGPAWIRTERYDISAKCPGKCESEQIPAMLRSLLQERFKLVLHHEQKEFTTFALVVGRGTQKLKQDESRPWETFSMDQGRRAAKSMTMRGLAQYVSMMTQSPVTDETGLSGHYDFPLEYTVEERGSKTGDWPSVFTVVDDLGLKLRAHKQAFDVVVVDGGHRVPSEN